MDLQNVLDFCNQYLMMKILVQRQPCTSKTLDSKSLSHQPKKNKAKGMKFQNPTKRSKQQQTTNPPNQDLKIEKTKKKRAKLEGGTRKKQLEIVTDIKNQAQYQNQEQGYVPIQNLLTQFNIKTEQKSKHENNFASFGTSQINYGITPNKNYNPYSYNTKPNYNYQPSSFNQISSPERFDDSWMYRNTRNDYNSMSQPVIQTLNLQYDSPIKKMYSNIPTAYQVPISRGFLQLDRSNSHSKISQNSVSKISRNQKSMKKNKKKGERSFYLPVSNNGSKQNLELSRCISTNNIMDRIQKEISEQNYMEMRNEKNEGDNSKIQTGYSTKFQKKQTSFKKDYDQYSQIQLDGGVRQCLSFLSEARGPPKPIPVHLKK